MLETVWRIEIRYWTGTSGQFCTFSLYQENILRLIHPYEDFVLGNDLDYD